MPSNPARQPRNRVTAIPPSAPTPVLRARTPSIAHSRRIVATGSQSTAQQSSHHVCRSSSTSLRAPSTSISRSPDLILILTETVHAYSRPITRMLGTKSAWCRHQRERLLETAYEDDMPALCTVCLTPFPSRQSSNPLASISSTLSSNAPISALPPTTRVYPLPR